MDWKAAMSSEIFREYVKSELIKEAHEVQEEVIDKSKIFNNFKEFEKRVNNDPKLKIAFSLLKKKLANDPEYRKKVHPDFINGIQMLFIDDEG